MCILVAIGMPVVVLQLKSLAIAIVASVLWVFLSITWLTRKHTPLWYRTSALVLTGYVVMISGYLVAGALIGPTPSRCRGRFNSAGRHAILDASTARRHQTALATSERVARLY